MASIRTDENGVVELTLTDADGDTMLISADGGSRSSFVWVGIVSSNSRAECGFHLDRTDATSARNFLTELLIPDDTDGSEAPPTPARVAADLAFSLALDATDRRAPAYKTNDAAEELHAHLEKMPAAAKKRLVTAVRSLVYAPALRNVAP
jgi:hypothetical protein